MELALQINVGLVDTPVAPFDGAKFDGVPGVGHGAAPVVNLQIDPAAEPQLFFATTLQ